MANLDTDSKRLLQLSLFAIFGGSVGLFIAHLSILFSLKGYAPSIIGLLLMFYNLSGIIGPLVITRVLQKSQNYKAMIVFLMGGMIILAIIFGLLSNVLLQFIAVFLYGILANSFSPVQEVTLVNSLHNPYKDYGMVRTVATVGYVSIALSITLLPIIDVQSQFSIIRFGVISAAIVGLCAILFIPKSNDVLSVGVDKAHKSFFATLKDINPKFYLILVLVFCNYIGLRTIEIYIGLYATKVYHQSSITLLFVISAGFEIVAIYFGQRIIERTGYILAWILVLFGTLLRLVGLGVATSIWWLYATQAFHILSFGIMLSAFIHFVNRSIAKKNRTIAMGLFQTAVSTASVLASVVGGYLLQYFGFSTMFFIAAISPAIGLVFVLINIRRLEFSELIPHSTRK